MARSMTTVGPTLSSPNWAGSRLDPDDLLPGGKIDASTITADSFGKKVVRSGYVVGRTITERNAGAAYGYPAADADDEVVIVAFDVEDAALINDIVPVAPGDFVVYENKLPDYGSLTSAILTKLRALYNCIRFAE